jgi:superfamily II DNA/RNA helicase
MGFDVIIRRHVLLLSATFPDTVKESASHWLKKPLCLKAKGPAAPNQSPAVKGADGPDETVEGADGGDETAEEEATPELGLSLTVNEVLKLK